MEKVILSVLGRGDLKETNYSFDGNRIDMTKFCCLAIAKLKKISKLYVLFTKEAKEKHYLSLKDEAEKANVELIPIEIASGATQKEVWDVFDVITDYFGKLEDKEIILDITNSFRHLPILTFGAMTYLESYKNVKISNIYYGAYESKNNETNVTPIFDITSIIQIIKGSFAIKTFETTGSVKQMSEFLEYFADFNKNNKAKIDEYLFDFDSAMSSGLAIEAGNAARSLEYWITEQLPKIENQLVAKASKEILIKISERLKKIRLNEKFKEKSKLKLDENELNRELELIKWYVDFEDYSTALLLSREWVVNYIMFKSYDKYIKKGNWLNHNIRVGSDKEGVVGIESSMCNNSSEIYQYIAFIPNGAKLMTLWRQMKNERNKYAHGSFQPDNADIEVAKNQIHDFLQLASLCMEIK